jgi:hypothetical protein
MKLSVRKEIFYLVGIVAIVMMVRLIHFLFGKQDPYSFDINLHDTYYVFTVPGSIWVQMTGACFIVYFVRAIITRFANLWILFILAFSSLAVIILLNHQTEIYFAYNNFNKLKGFVDYRVQSNGLPPSLVLKPVTALYYVYLVLQLLLVIMIGFIGFMIGVNWNKKRNKNA